MPFKTGDTAIANCHGRDVRVKLTKLVENTGSHTPPKWASVDLAAMSGSMAELPTREDIDIPINEQLIVEYYSR